MTLGFPLTTVLIQYLKGKLCLEETYIIWQEFVAFLLAFLIAKYDFFLWFDTLLVCRKRIILFMNSE